MLVDAGISYSHTIISLEEWEVIRRASDYDQFPYRGSPALIKVQPSGGLGLTLAETGAILEYLEEKLHLRLRAEEAEIDRGSRADVDGKGRSIIFSVDCIFQMSVEEATAETLTQSKTWLAPPSRQVIFEHVALPHLHGTEAMLKRLTNFPKTVTAVNVCMFTAFQLPRSMFPSHEGFRKRQAFQEMRRNIGYGGRRDVIERWHVEERVRERAWAASPFGTAGWERKVRAERSM